MVNKKMWDWMDKAEGRKDSSYDNMMEERARQREKVHEEKLMEHPGRFADSRRRAPKRFGLFGLSNKPLRFR